MDKYSSYSTLKTLFCGTYKYQNFCNILLINKKKL